MKSLLFVLAILSVSNSAFAFDETSHSSPNQAITFSVGPDEALTYPTDLVNLPDERPCNLKDNSGSSFDGFYPSFMSPGAPAGHTRNTGRVYFLNGCDTALPRAFVSRTFTIAGPSHRKAEDED